MTWGCPREALGIPRPNALRHRLQCDLRAVGYIPGDPFDSNSSGALPQAGKELVHENLLVLVSPNFPTFLAQELLLAAVQKKTSPGQALHEVFPKEGPSRMATI